jgi:hypothetical protein
VTPPALAILIPTLPERRSLLARLLRRLRPQRYGVQVVTLPDRGKLLIGEKRQRLLEDPRVVAPFVAFVDDDDLVSADYCPRILAGIASGADVVCFRVRCYWDGVLVGRAITSLTVGAWRRGESGADGLHYYERTPNHLNPIRRELALSVGYRAMRTGEDADYSRRLFDRHGAAMKEHFIDAYLYDYYYRTKMPKPLIAYDTQGRLTRDGAADAIGKGGTAVWRGRPCGTLAELEAADAL